MTYDPKLMNQVREMGWAGITEPHTVLCWLESKGVIASWGRSGIPADGIRYNVRLMDGQAPGMSRWSDGPWEAVADALELGKVAKE